MLRTIASPRLARAALGILVLVALLVWLGVRGAQAFDQRRHAALAHQVTTAPDRVSRRLIPIGLGARARAHGLLQYRPGTWLTVVSLHGLPPASGHERYLVFLHNWTGWSLAGAVERDRLGGAQLRSAAEPRPPTIFEVLVTRAADNASSDPHGTPVLYWFDASLAPKGAVPFFAVPR
ncbi:MAG TPA: hypothetical protein VFA46_17415 [Actinomycetes bacterium]|nr:hypothetical protein [Actinomycetes bacterium]